MSYTPSNKERATRRDRRQSRQQLPLTAQTQRRDEFEASEADRQEFVDELLREVMDYSQFVTDEQNREMILRGTNPITGRNFETVEDFAEYVDNTIDLLGPLTPYEIEQHNQVLAHIVMRAPRGAFQPA